MTMCWFIKLKLLRCLSVNGIITWGKLSLCSRSLCIWVMLRCAQRSLLSCHLVTEQLRALARVVTTIVELTFASALCRNAENRKKCWWGEQKRGPRLLTESVCVWRSAVGRVQCKVGCFKMCFPRRAPSACVSGFWSTSVEASFILWQVSWHIYMGTLYTAIVCILLLMKHILLKNVKVVMYNELISWFANFKGILWSTDRKRGTSAEKLLEWSHAEITQFSCLCYPEYKWHIFYILLMLILEIISWFIQEECFTKRPHKNRQ